jgi:predicted nucleotidyltransferase
MNPKVRARLLDIAYDFIDFLGVDIVVTDVVMTGSLANYNWSEYSDVDLHIITDFGLFSKTELPLYKDLFTLMINIT